jgi:16S rRNA U516 pseudouridylate synthase RsuA-like enzyme
MIDTGYFTISDSGKKTRHLSFELAAYTANRRSDIERIIEVDRVIVNGQLSTRERDVTSSVLDYLSTI